MDQGMCCHWLLPEALRTSDHGRNCDALESTRAIRGSDVQYLSRKEMRGCALPSTWNSSIASLSASTARLLTIQCRPPLFKMMYCLAGSVNCVASSFVTRGAGVLAGAEVVSACFDRGTGAIPHVIPAIGRSVARSVRGGGWGRARRHTSDWRTGVQSVALPVRAAGPARLFA